MPLELFTMLGSAVLGFATKMMANAQADKREQFLLHTKGFKNAEQSLKHAREFNSKSSNWARRFIVICIFTMLVFLLVAGAFIPTNLVVDIPKGSFLGLFSWGGGTEIVKVDGLVAFPWLRHAALSIIAFYFGQGSAKRP